MGFAHLHLHTEYSLLDGACRIGPLMRAAKEKGMTHLAVTDHGVMYGAVDFYKEGKKHGITPVIGCEVYVAHRTRFDRRQGLDRESNHLILLCENDEGYRNLMKMVSLAFTEGFYGRPRVDKELLEQYNGGLIALSACLAGETARALSRGDYEGAKETALWYRSVFGPDRYFLEIQNHGLEEQKRILPDLIRLSKETGIPLVATNDVHYIERTDAKMQQVLMCVATNTSVADPDKPSFGSDEFYLKTEEEMRAVFPDLPDAVDRSLEIARRCRVAFEFGQTKLPRFDIGERDHAEYMREVCLAGMRRHYGPNPPEEVVARFEHEMRVIREMGYVDYYLIVWDFVRFAKENGIPVGPGRGSGAGSLCAYLMGITGIDPMRYGLLFERFLNPERVSMPDFDIDFCYVRRQEVIDYVVRKYGADRVAQIVTFGTLAARAAIRDVGRAMGVPYAVCDQIAKSVPAELGITVAEALQKSNDLRERYENDPQIAELIDMAMKVEGMPRHASTHAAGVVITDRPVYEYVPLARNDEAVVAQFPMTTLEELGLLKMDFLGLRFLTVIHDTVDLIRRREPDFDIDRIPLDDPAVFETLSAGQTTGLFQLESAGMRSVLVRLKPESVEDLIAVISLFRPGPMDSIPKFIHNRHHPESVTYAAPALEPILNVTYGCLVYQEQVMQVFRSLAGYSLGRADIVRRAMSKKKHDVMERERRAFVYGDDEVPGCVRNGIPAEAANRIFDEMTSFASYAFNKSHAAAYALLAYQTAYLKTHYPREYLAALLTSVMDNTGKIAEYIAECGRLSVRVLPPDINRSRKTFVPDDSGGIRFSLLAIKNLGEHFIEQILEEREQNGPFESLTDFCERLSSKDMNRRAVEGLIKSGALDSIQPNRRQALEALPGLLDAVKEAAKNRDRGQIGFFDLPGARIEYPLPDVPDMTSAQKLSLEKEITGMYLSGHPLDDYRSVIESRGTATLLQVMEAGQPGAELGDEDRVRVIGIVGEIRLRPTRSGATMAYLKLEDLYAEAEVLVFPKVLERYNPLLVTGRAVELEARISLREDREPQLLCEAVREVPPPTAAPPPKKGPKAGLYLRVPSTEHGLFLRAVEIAADYPGDLPLYMVLKRENKKLLADKSRWVRPDPELIRALEDLLGPENVKTVT